MRWAASAPRSKAPSERHLDSYSMLPLPGVSESALAQADQCGREPAADKSVRRPIRSAIAIQVLTPGSSPDFARSAARSAAWSIALSPCCSRIFAAQAHNSRSDITWRRLGMRGRYGGRHPTADDSLLGVDGVASNSNSPCSTKRPRGCDHIDPGRRARPSDAV